MLRAALVASALILTGCASLADVGQEGQLTVILDKPRRIAEACVQMSGKPAAEGCMQALNDRFFILCPLDGASVSTAQCLAHEIRHIVEPGWQH